MTLHYQAIGIFNVRRSVPISKKLVQFVDEKVSKKSKIRPRDSVEKINNKRYRVEEKDNDARRAFWLVEIPLSFRLPKFNS